MRRLVLDVDGVEECTVEYDDGIATIKVRKDVDPEVLAAAVTAHRDFTATVGE